MNLKNSKSYNMYMSENIRRKNNERILNENNKIAKKVQDNIQLNR